MTAPNSSWVDLPHHRSWLSQETDRMLRFTMGSADPAGGFGWLNTDGSVDLTKPVEAWISTRMTHVMALGELLGVPGCRPLVAHGLHATRTILHDSVNGGWYSSADARNDGEKAAYDHSFVVISSSSAALCGHDGARELLGEALGIVERRFWDDERGVVVDVWNRDWTEREPYGGANANMHTVEAFLAAADVTGDRVWLERALRIASFFIDRHARVKQWRIPEHFDADWNELPEYNTDDRAHRFRPYGATIGHGFEWARLCLHLHASLGDAAPAWLVEGSRGLFDRAQADGWQETGFVYTTDWHGVPVVRDRLHWVVCEAIAAAAALHRLTGETRYEAAYRQYWDVAERHFIDRVDGSWHAQLDESNMPSSTVWSGKPDTYHAVQATILPRLPLAPSIASGVALNRRVTR